LATRISDRLTLCRLNTDVSRNSKGVELYFSASGIAANKQVPILLSSIGASTYALLSDLVAPQPPSAKSFAEISGALRKHFEPKRAIIAERFHFHKRDQVAGETIADFDAALRKLAVHCNFGESLEEALRDRFVCGLRHEAIQRRLLSEADLSYAKAMEIARAMEAADKNSKAFKTPEPAIRKFSSHAPKPRERQSCYRCGRANHTAADCKFKDAECHACGKTGHIAPACRSRPQHKTQQFKPKQQGIPQKPQKRHHRSTHRVQDEIPTSDSETSSGDEYHLHKLGEQSSNPIEVEVLVNDKKLVMEVDTGAALSIISEATRKARFPGLRLHKSNVILKTYTEEPMQVVGNLHVHVHYGSQQAKLVLVVVGGDGPSLFGRNWLNYIRLDWSNIAAVASAYGVGAVISHVFPDGSERPIAFASRTLSTSERNYAQLEKEALSLVFGVKKFHQYLYGRRFTLIMDHKPLTAILGPKKGIPSLAAARLQRWALLLSAYEYEIKYKSTHDHSNADGLSRLPLPSKDISPESVSIFNVAQIQALPVTFKKIQKATSRDTFLSKVLMYVQNGWPDEVEECIKPYKSRQNEIGIETGCLMWGIRVIVPENLQSQILASLHQNHPGITRMKAIARSYFWWSGLDKDIEDLAKSCSACQALKSSPAVAPLHPWIWPDAPWKRIHVDFAGPFYGKMFFIVVDAHSKWPEVVMMSSTTSQSTIEALRSIFAHHGLPEQLVSDNGPQFISEEFSHFVQENGIKHVLCAPYHPSSNGLAERFVQTFKRAMKAGEGDGKSLNHRLSDFLFDYRSSEHATTAVSPSELLFQRKLRTRFDLLRPDTKSVVTSKQADQKMGHDKHSKLRSLFPGQPVMVRDFRKYNKWTPGHILKKLGPVTYSVEIENGHVVKRHIDHLTQRMVSSAHPTEQSIEDENDFQCSDDHDQSAEACQPARERLTIRQYPHRDRQPPERLMFVN
jgi:hypothetical protein